MKNNTILVLNGPAETGPGATGDRFGNVTVARARDECSARCKLLGVACEFRQAGSNEELTRWIVEDGKNYSALIVTPFGDASGDTAESDRYRSALDMIASLDLPVVEVHGANIFQSGTEGTAPLAGAKGPVGLICGLGVQGYLLAISATVQKLRAGQ